MIAAAAAAMIGGAQAIVCVDDTEVCTKDCEGCYECETVEGGAGVAHKVTISLKTTAPKSKITRASKCEDPECLYWREQKTLKISGLIWAQLADCEGCYDFADANTALWTKDEAIDAVLELNLGLIGKGTDSKKCEAYGTLAGEDFGVLAWAGFGTMDGKKVKEASKCNDDGVECSMWAKSISGGIAGKLVAVEPEDACDVIEYDGCCDDMQLDYTAAYGTIKIAYDKSTSKKVATAEDDEDVASFFKVPAAVEDDITVNVVIEE